MAKWLAITPGLPHLPHQLSFASRSTCFGRVGAVAQHRAVDPQRGEGGRGAHARLVRAALGGKVLHGAFAQVALCARRPAAHLQVSWCNDAFDLGSIQNPICGLVVGCPLLIDKSRK